MTRRAWLVALITLIASLASGCVHGTAPSRPYPGIETYSDGASRFVTSYTGALQARDRETLGKLSQPDFLLTPATKEAAAPFVSVAKLRVERYVAAAPSEGPPGADAATGGPAIPLSGDQARAYLLERRERFAGVAHNDARITGLDRHGDRCTVKIHASCAGIDATEARMQEDSWWTWTLIRRADSPQGWAIAAAVEDHRTLVIAPGPIYRQVYPEEEGPASWRPASQRTPPISNGSVPGDFIAGGVAVVYDCVARGACLLLGGGTSVAALTRGDPNDEGALEDRAALLYLKPLSGESESILTGDFNNDGMTDLFVSYQDAPCRLYLGRRYMEDAGKGQNSTRLQHVGFEDVTEPSGLGGLIGPYRTAVGLDADRDGWLDLYIVQYGDAAKTAPSADGRNGLPNRFFRNMTQAGGPLTFVDESHSSGTDDSGWGLSAAAADYDGDGRPDLFVANAFGRQILYRNITEPHGPIKFTDASGATATGGDGMAMGVAWGDYDNDGDLDLFVSGYWFDERWVLTDPRFPLRGSSARQKLQRAFGGNALFRNDVKQSGRFVRVSEPAGIVDGGWSWGATWADVDGDGRLDLIVANGLLSGKGSASQEVALWSELSAASAGPSQEVGAPDIIQSGVTGPQRDRLFLNLGDGTFAEVGWAAGFDTTADLRGLIAADITGDGAPEIIGSAYAESPVVFENTNMSDVGHITLQLNGTASNWDAVGAIVRLTDGGITQVREVSAGGSFLSDAGRLLTFGLAPTNTVDSIEVDWPSGRHSSVKHPTMNRRGIIEITEPPPPELAAPPASPPKP